MGRIKGPHKRSLINGPNKWRARKNLLCPFSFPSFEWSMCKCLNICEVSSGTLRALQCLSKQKILFFVQKQILYFLFFYNDCYRVIYMHQIYLAFLLYADFNIFQFYFPFPPCSIYWNFQNFPTPLSLLTEQK